MLNFFLYKVRFLALFFCSMALSACNSTILSNPKLEEIHSDIVTLHSNLDQQYSKICEAQQTGNRLNYNDVKKEHDKIRARLKASQKKYAELKKHCEVDNTSDKITIGEIENVSLLDEGLTFSARIDTGAETSSLGVYQLQNFERDGRNWVKFKLSNDKSAKTYEYRVSGRVRIKQVANSEDDVRFEIKVNIAVGETEYPKQVFNLSDRSYLEHQILIGRNFLTDTAIVDTSSKYLLKK